MLNLLCAVLCFWWFQALLVRGAEMHVARVIVRRPGLVVRYCTAQSRAGAYRRLEWVSI